MGGRGRHDISKMSTRAWDGHLEDHEKVVGQDVTFERLVEHGNENMIWTRHDDETMKKGVLHSHHAELPTLSWVNAHNKPAFVEEITARDWKVGLHRTNSVDVILDRRKRRGSLFEKTCDMKRVLAEIEHVGKAGKTIK